MYGGKHSREREQQVQMPGVRADLERPRNHKKSNVVEAEYTKGVSGKMRFER